jgi:hypothetical protein
MYWADILVTQIQGLVVLGTSLDYESSDSRSKGCWDPAPILASFFEKWTTPAPTPDFVVDEAWCGMFGGFVFGDAVKVDSVGFWEKTIKDVYSGDEGRQKVRMAAMCLLSRDGLLVRLQDIKAPVYWLQVSSIDRYPLCPCLEHREPFSLMRTGNGGRSFWVPSSA